MKRTNVKLFDSSLDGDLEGVMAALTQGGCVAMRNQQGGTPLLAAAQSGHTDMCGLLLENGSDVNIRIPEGFTPLLAAAQFQSARDRPPAEAVLITTTLN